MGDRINHPGHYNMGGEIGEDGSAEFEVIKIIEDLGWGFEFCMGNALKYILRAPHKHETELEDLKKARWYLERAKHHASARIRPRAFRKIDMVKATEAWGLIPQIAPEEDLKDAVATTKPDPSVDHMIGWRLTLAVDAISSGDPFEALNNLNMYMLKFGAGK